MIPISIRFRLVRVSTGYRRGPRFQYLPDKAGLHGAALCVASMVRSAVISRDAAASEPATPYARWQRAQMRQKALWARVFAGQLRNDDPRFENAAAYARAALQPVTAAA